MNQKSANLWAYIALFSTPLWNKSTCPFFSTLQVTFVVDTQVAPANTWQTEEENHCLWSTCLCATKGLNAMMADTWVLSPPKYSWWDLLWWNTNQECLPKCWELWRASKPPSNKVQLVLEVWIYLWHVLPEPWKELVELMQGETHKSPFMSMEGDVFNPQVHRSNGFSMV